VYLHYVLDLWFEKRVRKQVRGMAMLLRYADDFVVAFEHETEARRFMLELPARLEKFGLRLAGEKTALVRFSRHASKGDNGGFDFLGFHHRWEDTRKGNRKIQRRTSAKKRQAAEARMRQWVKKNRHLRVGVLLRSLSRKLTGYWNYYGVSGNMKALNTFWREVQKALYQWLNRRSQKRSCTWERLYRMLDQHAVPRPRILAHQQMRLCLTSR
jgi:hypothetical protein